MAHAEQLREDAERARTNAANCPDAEAAARWQQDAEHLDQEADRVEASSMDWLAEPSGVYGFEGPPPAADPHQQRADTAQEVELDESTAGADPDAETVEHPERRSVEAFMDAWADAFTAAEAEGRETELFATVVGAPDPAPTDAHQRGVADGYAGGPYNEDLFADEQHGAAYRAGLQEGRTAAVDEELLAAYGPEPAGRPAERANDNGHDDTDGM